MFNAKGAFSGFSVNDLAKARDFYTETLGLKTEAEGIGLRLQLPDGGSVFVYPKEDHQPATFTILNLVVDDIEGAVDELKGRGVRFEQVDVGPKTDEKGILRGKQLNLGPDIAWFKDPAGNFLAVVEQ
jgi:catechol 2,3-dioxygenase-like lactoylglutathione lyase family enzyme